MMRKLAIMSVILAVGGSAVSAAEVWLEVDPADTKEGYLPDEIITINLVADFAVGATSLSISVTGGVPSGGILHPYFPPWDPPWYWEPWDGGWICKHIGGGIAVGQPPVPAGQALFSFELLPNEPESTIITIDDVTDYSASPPLSTAIVSPDYSVYLTDVTLLAIHVIPEPATIALFGLGGLWLLRRRK
ncbi:MAG: PEP-CTERM sorting domain-containing protein [Planctomycetota bacterium]|jgi:hypothetical protein